MKTVTRGLLAASVLLGSAQSTAAQAEGGRPLDLTGLIAVSMLLVGGVIITVVITWFEHRSRVKALDVLRVYAERNEEPPASVTQALTGFGPHILQAPPKPPATRGHHLAHVAANVVFALGAIGIVWWKDPDPGNPGGFVIFVRGGRSWSSCGSRSGLRGVMCFGWMAPRHWNAGQLKHSVALCLCGLHRCLA